MPKKRLNFLCWNCGLVYSLYREPIKNQLLKIACPYCGEDGEVDLSPYPTRTIESFKSEVGAKIEIEEPVLPETLPTQPPSHAKPDD